MPGLGAKERERLSMLLNNAQVVGGAFTLHVIHAVAVVSACDKNR